MKGCYKTEAWMPSIRIGERRIGEDSPAFIIAEAGINHNGRVETALEMVDAAADAGCDAIKFQTYFVDKLISRSAMKRSIDATIRQHYDWTADDTWMSTMDKRLTNDEYELVAERAAERGIIFFSSPWDKDSCDMLDELGVSVYKIGSGDLTYLPFIEYVASKRKPLIVSVGMGGLDEIQALVDTVREAGNDDLAILHCIVSYPTTAADANLNFIRILRSKFEVPVGYSDHTIGIEVAALARATGATIIEKHFTLDKEDLGLDQNHSLDANEMAALVREIRSIEAVLGPYKRVMSDKEKQGLILARRSIVAARDLKAGTKLTIDDIDFKRPGGGTSPAEYKDVVGKTLKCDIEANEFLAMEDLF